MKFAGHNDYVTTKTYYIFDEEIPADKKEAFEKALCPSVPIKKEKSLGKSRLFLKYTAGDGT